MPVRKIPVNYRVLTGRQALKRLHYSVDFESPVERDFLLLLDLDRDVKAVEGQPVSIPWRDERGREFPYRPDFLVTFLPGRDQLPIHQPLKAKPWLVEVKPHQELKENWRKYHRRFRAAVAYARERDWKFRIWTDRRIRTPRLENARQLLRFMTLPYEKARCEALLRALENCGTEMTARELIAAVCQDPINQAMLWSLVAWRNIGADLSRPLDMESALWLPEYMPRNRPDPNP